MTLNPESGCIGPPHIPATTAEGRTDVAILAQAGIGGSEPSSLNSKLLTICLYPPPPYRLLCILSGGNLGRLRTLGLCGQHSRLDQPDSASALTSVRNFSPCDFRGELGWIESDNKSLKCFMSAHTTGWGGRTPSVCSSLRVPVRRCTRSSLRRRLVAR